MNTTKLKIKLYFVAVKGFKSARRHNPFWTTREASTSIVGAFNLIRNN